MRCDGVPDVPCFPAGVVRAERCGRLAVAADRDAGGLYAGDGAARAVSRFRRSGAAFAGAGDESGMGAVPHGGVCPFRDCRLSGAFRLPRLSPCGDGTGRFRCGLRWRRYGFPARSCRLGMPRRRLSLSGRRFSRPSSRFGWRSPSRRFRRRSGRGICCARCGCG